MHFWSNFDFPTSKCCTSGDGVGVKAERSKGGNDTWGICWPEEGPQGVDPPPSRKICFEWAPCSSHTSHIPPRVLCHGHSLWGCYYQGMYTLTQHVALYTFSVIRLQWDNTLPHESTGVNVLETHWGEDVSRFVKPLQIMVTFWPHWTQVSIQMHRQSVYNFMGGNTTVWNYVMYTGRQK